MTWTRRLALAWLAAVPPAGRAAAATASDARGLFAADPLTGIALRGFDPVSYFAAVDGQPLPGRPGLELVQHGLVWRFAGLPNRETFRADPEVYEPRLGGYDPWGIVRGRLVDADPLLPALVEGRLYLFRSETGRADALRDAGLLERAESLWPELRPSSDT